MGVFLKPSVGLHISRRYRGESVVETLTFDLRTVATELDRKSRGVRMGALAGSFAFLGITLIFVILILPGPGRGSPDDLKLGAAAVLVGFTALIFRSPSQMLWGARRSAIRLTIDSKSLRLLYPEGREVSFAWTDPKMKFELDDFSTSSRLTLSTPYALDERNRLSALTADCHSEVLERAQRFGTATPMVPRRSWMFPGVLVPSA